MPAARPSWNQPCKKGLNHERDLWRYRFCSSCSAENPRFLPATETRASTVAPETTGAAALELSPAPQAQRTSEPATPQHSEESRSTQPGPSTRFGQIAEHAQTARRFGYRDNQPVGANAGSKQLSQQSPQKPVAESTAKQLYVNCNVYISEVTVTTNYLGLPTMERHNVNPFGEAWHNAYFEAEWRGRPN